MSQVQLKNPDSIIWQYFTPLDAKYIKCTICDNSLRSGPTIQNLSEHLRRRHRASFNSISDALKAEENSGGELNANEIPIAIENIKYDNDQLTEDTLNEENTDADGAATIINADEILIQEANNSETAEIEMNENTEVDNAENVRIADNSDIQIVKIVPLPHARSEVWTYFGFVANDEGQILDRTKVVCKICASTFCYSGNTTNFYSHLKSMHSEIQMRALPFKTNKSIKRSYSNMVEESGDVEYHSSSDPNNSTYNSNHLESGNSEELFQKGDNLIYVEDITESIVDFLVTDCRPLCIVQGKGFQRLLQLLAPNYSLPDKQKLTIAIRKRYDELRKEKDLCFDKFGPNNY